MIDWRHIQIVRTRIKGLNRNAWREDSNIKCGIRPENGVEKEGIWELKSYASGCVDRGQKRVHPRRLLVLRLRLPEEYMCMLRTQLESTRFGNDRYYYHRI